MTDLQELGKKGEEIAKNYLVELNFTIIETNWRFGHLEVDIIAQNQNTIVFCEVKTRSSVKMGDPEQSVTLQKQRNLIKAANHYVVKNKINKEVQFDIITVVTSGDTPIINHIPDAYTSRW